MVNPLKFYLNLLTSRPAWLLCRFINDLPLVFFSRSLASVNLLLKAEPYITLSEQPDHVNVLSSPTLDWSQPQPGSSPLEQPLVTATLTPAAVIACMYAASRVPVKQKRETVNHIKELKLLDHRNWVTVSLTVIPRWISKVLFLQYPMWSYLSIPFTFWPIS